MEWDLQYGPSIEKLQALREAGKKIAALDRRPDLPVTLEWVWEAFAEFNASRNWTMGVPQPIQLSEIIAYATLKGLTREESDELRGHVRRLDTVFFKFVEEKRKADGRVGSTNRRPQRPKGR